MAGTPYGVDNFGNYNITNITPAQAALPSDNGAAQAVSDRFQSSQQFAESAYNSAQTFISNMANTQWLNIGINAYLNKLDLNIAQFNTLLGTLPTRPTNTFAFTEVPYSSNLLTDLRARLLEWVDGKSTGILPSVEQAIWDRGRAREVVSSNRKAQEAVRSFAMRGFSKPPGALSVEIQDAVQAAQDASVTLSRDVMIKQAEMEQANRRFSFEQAAKMEEALLAYTSQQAQRTLDAARELQKFLIDIYAQDVNAYGVKTQAYKARVDSEVSVFKAESDVNIAEGNLRVEAAKATIQQMIQQITLKAEAVKAGAQVSGQLCAAAMSSINVSAGVSAQSSESAGNTTHVAASISGTTSLGMQANYSYSGSI